MSVPIQQGGPPDEPAGMLLVWTSVRMGYDADFNRWYDREHVEERVRIPGFLSAARYRCTSGTRRYLGLYRTTSLRVFETAAYRNAFQNQTPWSIANFSRMRNPMRRVCAIDGEAGTGVGAWLALLRLGTSAIGSDFARIRALGKELVAIDGIVGARRLCPDAALSTPLPAEQVRGRTLDPILLIEATSERAAARAARRAERVVGRAMAKASLLQLMWHLHASDVPQSESGA